jgi:hypothetical protein
MLTGVKKRAVCLFKNVMFCLEDLNNNSWFSDFGIRLGPDSSFYRQDYHGPTLQKRQIVDA